MPLYSTFPLIFGFLNGNIIATFHQRRHRWKVEDGHLKPFKWSYPSWAFDVFSWKRKTWKSHFSMDDNCNNWGPFFVIKSWTASSIQIGSWSASMGSIMVHHGPIPMDFYGFLMYHRPIFHSINSISSSLLGRWVWHRGGSERQLDGAGFSEGLSISGASHWVQHFGSEKPLGGLRLESGIVGQTSWGNISKSLRGQESHNITHSTHWIALTNSLNLMLA